MEFKMISLLKKMLLVFGTGGFASYVSAFVLVLLISVLLYLQYVYKPYSKFPSCRLEHRVPYWILKRIPFNYAVMQTFIEQSKRYESEGVFALWIGAPHLIVYGEEIVKNIVNVTDKPKSYRLLEYTIGRGILTSNGDVWKKQKKMATPAFHVVALKSYASTMNKHSREMVKVISGLDGQPTDDVINIVSICTMGILDETNLGTKEKNQGEYIHVVNVLNKYAEMMAKRLWSPWLYFDFALRLFPSTRQAHKSIQNLLRDNLKPRLEKIKDSLISLQASPLASEDCRRLRPMGESFVEQHLRDPTITMEEITRQTSVLVAGGFDTIIYSLQYSLFLLGLHQDVQNRAFQEVTSETEGDITYDDLQRLTYLECVIKESLRLYPTIPLYGRQLKEDLQCGEYKLLRNSYAWVFCYMLHRNPEIFPDPEKFDPERFMDEDSKIKPWNFLPFSEGLRSCIGKNYALAQMKIVLAHVLRHFRIVSMDRMEDLHFSWYIVLHCTKKLRLQFMPRK